MARGKTIHTAITNMIQNDATKDFAIKTKPTK
jgi:hypothetical protein